MSDTAEFQLDTSGEVGPYQAAGPFNVPGFLLNGVWVSHLEWSDRSPFVQGYVKAMLVGVFVPSQHHIRKGRAKPAGYSDLAPETLARIIEDCAAFGRAVGKDPSHNAGLGSRFWESRQSGFSSLWSLHQAEFAAAFPPLTVSHGDDGKVRFR